MDPRGAKDDGTSHAGVSKGHGTWADSRPFGVLAVSGMVQESVTTPPFPHAGTGEDTVCDSVIGLGTRSWPQRPSSYIDPSASCFCRGTPIIDSVPDFLAADSPDKPSDESVARLTRTCSPFPLFARPDAGPFPVRPSARYLAFS